MVDRAEAVGAGELKGLVFTDAPMLVYWELTRACDLACRHCRAEAIAQRDRQELSTWEAKRLLREIRGFGAPPPQLVMTGGDPLKRPDFFELVDYGVSLGIPVSVAPSATPLLTRDAIRSLKAAGIQSMSLSIDGSTAERHDRFRGVDGCFASTLSAARHIREEAIPLQINTLVCTETMPELPGVFGLLQDLGIMRWSLFYLIRTGRGRDLREFGPSQCERLHHWVYELAEAAPFAIKATEAPHFRRVAYVRMRAGGYDDAAIRRTAIGRGFGVRDGNGIMFISHAGDVYPSGFLPLGAGNVRRQAPYAIYRDAPVFTAIRDVDRYAGKCGRCEFRGICGGSRARAFATTGDPLAADPLCAYAPGSEPATGGHPCAALASTNTFSARASREEWSGPRRLGRQEER
jgi:radical SAM protein